MKKYQTLKNQKGEVEFRKKLSLQFDGKKTTYEGQPSTKEYIQILKDRIDTSAKHFEILKKKNIPLSPFVEIGAERGQRALLLENKFHATGVALDISFESLEGAIRLRKKFQYKKLPLLFCADAYTLPFKSNSIPFVFCYQTLHHFPDPEPILKEIYRILAPGGYFYFNEEPITQTMNFKLWRRDFHLRWWEKILKKLLLLPFLSTIGKSETDEGILEETFTLKTWEKSLNIFENVEVKLSLFPFGHLQTVEKLKLSQWLKPAIISSLLLHIFGGGIEGICSKKGKLLKTKNILIDTLLCLNCNNSLVKKEKSFYCNNCKTMYQEKKGVFFFLKPKQMKVLYPHYI